MQLQPLKLTDTSTKLRVYVCFQRRVQLNGLHFDMEILIVLLTQFSTTKSKSTLIPGSKFKFSPKPLKSFLKSNISTSNQTINMDSQHTLNISVVSKDSSKFQEQVTQRNRQTAAFNLVGTSTRGNTFHRTGRRENPSTRVHLQVTQNQLVEGLG